MSLAMDAFAVSITKWFCNKWSKLNNAILIWLSFWFFQFIMPVIWFYIWINLKWFISWVDHWIAFILLSFVWWKMLQEAFSSEEDETCDNDSWISLKSLIVLGIATSIDALIVWIALSVNTWNIFFTASLIWIITFVLSFVWYFIWEKFGKHFGSKAEIFGWLVLIWLGIKILIEHIF